MMRIIGLTGGIACGKSTVSGMLRSFGAQIVDADQISHQLTAPGGDALPLIREKFGDGVFAPDWTLCRERLAKKVFASEEARQKLNNILHPMVFRKMEEQIALCREKAAPLVVLDVPLLFETGGDKMAEDVLLVTAPEEIQIQRLKSRNGLSREEALSRIRSQMPTREKAARSRWVVDTNCPMSELEKKIHTLYQEWLRP